MYGLNNICSTRSIVVNESVLSGLFRCPGDDFRGALDTDGCGGTCFYVRRGQHRQQFARQVGREDLPATPRPWGTRSCHEIGSGISQVLSLAMPRFVELRRLITFLTDESNLDLKSFSFARLRRPLASQRSLDASTSTVPIRHGRTRNRHPGFGRRQLDSEPAVRNGEYDARRLPGRGFLDGKIRNSKRQSRTKIYLYHSPFHDSLRAAEHVRDLWDIGQSLTETYWTSEFPDASARRCL